MMKKAIIIIFFMILPVLLNATPIIRTPTQSFPDIFVGNSVFYGMYVYNDGDTTLTVNTITPKFIGDVFQYWGPKPFDVPPYSSKAVTFKFTPPSVGSFSGTFNVNSNASNAPNIDLTLTGKGILPAPDIVLSTTSFNFSGTTLHGRCRTGLPPYYNQGVAPLLVTDIRRTSGSQWFEYVGPAPPFEIPVSGTGEVKVNYCPRDGTTHSAVFTIYSNDPDEPAVTITFSGTSLRGAAIRQPVADINFGEVAIGEQLDKTTTIYNDGNRTLTITDITYPGGDFNYIGPSVPFDIIIGNSKPITVRFAPGSAGSKSTIFTIHSNDLLYPTVQFKAEGVGKGIPDINVSLNPVGFGDVEMGTSSEKILTISNEGTGTLTIYSINITGSTEFSCPTPSRPFDIPPGGQQLVTLRFSPLSEGVKTAILTINSNDPDESPINISLSGTGTGIPDILHPVPPLDFGNVMVNESLEKTMSITNEGSGELTVNSVTPVSTGSEFTYIGPSTPFNIIAGSSELITMRFSPTSEGIKNAVFNIHSNDPDEANVTFDVTGNGTTKKIPEITLKQEGTVISNGGTFAFGSHEVGTNTDKTFTIENTGTADLILNGSPIIAITGTNRDQFSVQQQPNSPVSPGDSTLFIVRFSPTSPGDKQVSISIASNDSDRTPYTIGLTGRVEKAAPYIDSINPLKGTVGTSVTINGSNFGSSRGVVRFNGVSASINSWTETQVKTVVPGGAKTGGVVIWTSNGKQSNSVTFTVETGPPTVTITKPTSNSTVKEFVDIEAKATSSPGVKKVEFYVDSKGIGSDSSDPYTNRWDSKNVVNGQHEIKAVVYDNDNRSANHSIWVTVDNKPPETKTTVTGKVTNRDTGNGIPGAVVKIGTLPSVNTDPGGYYTYNDVPSGEYNITITKSGYNTMSKTLVIPSTSGSVIKNYSLSPKASGEIKVISIQSKYDGFLHFLAGTGLSVTYTANIDWGGHSPGKVKFITPKGQYDVNTSNSTASKAFNIATHFSPCTTLKAVAISSDGAQSKEKQADFIVMPSFISDLTYNFIDLGDGYHYRRSWEFNILDKTIKKVPDDIPLLGGHEVGLQFKPKVDLDIGMDGTVDISGEFDDVLSGEFGIGRVAGIEYSVGGHVRINGNFVPGCTYQWGGEVGISASVTKDFPPLHHTVPIPIPPFALPLVFKASFSLSLGSTLGVSGNNFDFSGYSGIFTLTPYIRGSAGIGWDFLNASGWLGGGFEWMFKYPQNTHDFTVYINGGVSVTALAFYWETQLFELEWSPGSTRAMNLANYSQKPPQLISRGYLNLRQPFQPAAYQSYKEIEAGGKIYTTMERPFQTDIFPNSDPCLSSKANHLNLTWVQDNSGRSSINRTMAVFSTFNGTNWNEPETVWDDGTADFHPNTLTFSDGSVWTTWENVKSQLQDSDSLETQLSNLEISIASFNPDSKTWNKQRLLTSNNYLDRSPTLSGNTRDNSMLVFIANQSDHMLGNSECPNQLFYSLYNGKSWSTPKMISEIAMPVLDYSLKYNDVEAYLVLNVDTDDDPSTIYDHEIYLVEYESGKWETPKRLTNDSMVDSNPMIVQDLHGNNLMVWVRGDEVCGVTNFNMSSRKTIITDDYHSNIADFKLVSSNDGRHAIVWARPSDFSSDLFAVFYDPVYDVWGKPIQLTSDSKRERNITAAFYGIGSLVAVYDRDDIEEVQQSHMTSNGTSIMFTIPKVKNTDLCIFTLIHEIGRDLALEDGSLEIFPSNPAPGSSVTINVNALNLGDEAADNIPVAFYNGDPSGNGIKIGETAITGIFKPGDELEVSTGWTLPDVTVPVTIYAVIDPERTFDPGNSTNNKVSAKILKPDFAIRAVYWSKLSDSIISVVTRIVNDGAIPGDATTLTFRNESSNGVVLLEQEVVSLDRSESVDIDFEWDVSGIDTAAPSLYIAVDEDNSVEESDEENNEKEIVINLSGENLTSEISLNRSSLYMAALDNGISTSPQSFLISNSGDGFLNWAVSDDKAWLNCSPESGANSAMVTVSVDAAGLTPGTHTGTITITDPNAVNSPQTVTVTLKVKNASRAQPPFGIFATPVDDSTVMSSIPVTGWVLDDIEVESVKIYREPVPGEGIELVYIGDGLFVEGARPDVEQVYPTYPLCFRAGWGYMMLTNFLPDGGNGTFIIHAIAADKEGHQVTLGAKKIICDNANAVRPFGAIDTPKPGGEASGTNYRNHGWVLTPMPNRIPEDGSTINVWIDGVNLGNPTYNFYRDDIAALFPGYANSNGAHGYFDFDTTQYSNGVHTIQWTAVDDVGNADGIGSRYFMIRNTGGATGYGHAYRRQQDVSTIPIDYSSPVIVKKGFGKNIKSETLYPDKKDGIVKTDISEAERIELHLGDDYNCSYSGYLLVGKELRLLPIGSTLDREKGILSWWPGVGFIGEYDLIFIKTDSIEDKTKIKVKIVIKL